MRRRGIRRKLNHTRSGQLRTPLLSNSGPIPLYQLERDPAQPRSMADEEKLEELITAILREGLIQPIAVRPTSESSYQIIAGHRRVAAFQRLHERTKGTDRQRQYEAIPAIVKAPLDEFRNGYNCLC